MAATQYVHIPGYVALIFRRTYADLALPGAIMDRSFGWFNNAGAAWVSGLKTWIFPSGAKLTFAYLDHEATKYRYQGIEAQFIAFDELTQFEESQYLYLFSRLRRLERTNIPLRMRAASNPGGVGHDWVRARFVDSIDADRPFFPSRLQDNPYLDQVSYRASLMKLDAATREQLLNGDWNVIPEGEMFKRHYFEFVDEVPVQCQRVRYWDKAATEGGGSYTAGVKIARDKNGIFYIEHAIRGQWSSHQRELVMRQIAEEDGRNVPIWIEQEGGSAGMESAQVSIKNLAGFQVRADHPTGGKGVRAWPLAAQAEAGNVRIKRGPWNQDYLNELCSFPSNPYKDQVDASSGAFNKLAQLTALKREASVLPR